LLRNLLNHRDVGLRNVLNHREVGLRNLHNHREVGLRNLLPADRYRPARDHAHPRLR
jgi:hypothetical protein